MESRFFDLEVDSDDNDDVALMVRVSLRCDSDLT